MNIANVQKIDSKTYEFDLTIKSNSGNIELTSYQCSVNFPPEIANNGTLSFLYINNSSELSNKPSSGIKIITYNSKKYLTLASGPGYDILTSEAKRIGRFRITNTADFAELGFYLGWEFNNKINTILTGTNFAEITNPNGHFSDMAPAIPLSISSVNASATTDPNTAPEKTIDGLGYNDGDPNSRWAAQPLPQHLIYDLGFQQELNQVNVSFFKFNEGRVYTYSIYVSNDLTTWTEVVYQKSSAPQEWSESNFPTVNARYVKIDITGSINNPDNWANVWEVEIYKNNGPNNVDENSSVPENFELSQNYPNPFNPTTNIQYSLKEKSAVTLSVFNILGEKMFDLVNDVKEAGIYTVKVDGSDLTSGIYFYKISINNNFTDTKKMILLK